MTDIFDLSHRLTPETPVYSLDAPLEVTHTFSHERDGFALSAIRLSSHAGTHMDAPRHMLASGRTLDEFPVARFLGSGLVLDLRGRGPALSAHDLREAARVAETAAAAATLDATPAGAAGAGADPQAPPSPERGGPPLGKDDFALLWTGWDAHFGAPDQFDHPYLTAEAAEFLRNLGVTLVATDACSVDADLTEADADPHNMDLSAHFALMEADVLIVENIRGLEQIAGRRVRCAFLPLRVVGAEGSPIRAIAWVE